MVSSESLGFRIVCFIIVTLVAAYILAVLIYFNQAKNCGTCCLSTSEINTMMVLGGILFVIVIFLWIWCLIRLFFVRRDRAVVNAVAYKRAPPAPVRPAVVQPQPQPVISPLNSPAAYTMTPFGSAPSPVTQSPALIPASPVQGFNLTPTLNSASSIPISTTLSLADANWE